MLVSVIHQNESAIGIHRSPTERVGQMENSMETHALTIWKTDRQWEPAL